MNWWKNWKKKNWDEIEHSGRGKDGKLIHIPITEVPPLRAWFRKMKLGIQENPLTVLGFFLAMLTALISAIPKLISALYCLP